MNKIVIALLLIALFVSQAESKRYTDLRAVYLRKAIQHKRLAAVFYTRSRKFSGLARHYHKQARLFHLRGVSHVSRARGYNASAKRHAKYAYAFKQRYTYASRRSGFHLRRQRHFTKVAIKYESLARTARNRAKHHYTRYLYYLRLYKSYRNSYHKEERLKNASLRREFNERRLQKSYTLKSRSAQRSYRSYFLKAQRAQSKKRTEFRLFKKYKKLHRRAVYRHHARVHRLKMRRYLKKAKFAYRIAKHQHKSYVKWIRIENQEIDFARSTGRKIELIEKRINELKKSNDSDDLENVRKLRLILSDKTEEYKKHKSNEVYAHQKANKHRQIEIRESRVYATYRRYASVERTKYRKWKRLYRSTFSRRRVVVRRVTRK